MKTAIITGASRGIGRSIALLLAKEKKYDCIVITCRSNAELLNSVANEITACGVMCLSFVGDISSYDFTRQMISSLQSRNLKISLLVNNAAISYVGLLIDMTPEEWQKSINVNLNSIFNTCRLTVPMMIQEMDGRIINISSVWGLCGASCEVAYSATKGAVNSFTKALAKELAPSHIAVNAICFGAVDTEMNSHLSDEEKEDLCEEIPYGSMLSPDDAALAVLKVIEMPAYMTGETIKIDGGWI